ncbi:MAG: Wzz/FepE/Etk N-terminal domain-containing protein [Candidatus Sulfotelmatobacter sp.]
MADPGKVTQTNGETIGVRKSDPTLRDLLAPLFRRKRTVIYTFCGVLLGAILATILVWNTHQASMEILVNSERLEPMLTPESTQSAGSAPQVTDALVNSEIELLKSPDLLEQVVRKNHLDKIERKSWSNLIVYGKQDDPWYIAKAVDNLGQALNMKEVTKTTMIGITYNAFDPKRAFNVLQALANGYLEKHLAVNRPPGSYVFFSSEADKYQQALQQSEARLADFSKKYGDAAPDLEKEAMAQHVIESVAALHEAEQHIAGDQQRILDNESRLKVTPERSLSQEATDSAQALLQKLQGDLLDRQVKRTQLTLKYDPGYPLVQEQDREIAQTQTAIAEGGKLKYFNQTTDRDPTHELIRADIENTKADLASHQASAAALEKTVQALRTQMVELDHRALEQADLARELKVNETNYLLYVSKREQERTSDALDEKRIANVSIAVPPVLPILPFFSPVLVMLIGIALAVFLSLGLACVLEYLNPSLRTPDDVLEVLRIPVLASVPKQSA